MEFLMEPWAHQRRAIDLSSQNRDLALFYEMGCVAGDTEIRVNRAGGSRKYTIKEVFERFNKSWDPKIKTRVRGLRKGSLGLSELVDAWEAGVKPVYLLKAGKFSLKATLDHKIWTQNGWRKLGSLVPGDLIAVDTASKHQRKPVRKKVSKPRYNLRTVGEYYPHGHMVTIHGNRRRKAEIHRLTMEASLNKVDLETYVLATHSPKFSKFKTIDPQKFHVHHKDHNSKNNVFENLEVLAKKDHQRKHGDSAHFPQFDLAWEKISSIKCVGKEMTYDLQCEKEHPSFVGNGIVLHNSGKTGTAINMVRARCVERQRLMRVLILAPVIVLKNWKREFAMHSRISQSRIEVLYGAGKKRAEAFDHFTKDPVLMTRDRAGVVITNYESMQMEDLFKMILQWQPEVLICDESHRLKNHKSKRARAVAAIADGATHRYILTGTPILNSAQDIFMQFRILDSGRTFGRNFFAFRAKYFVDTNERWKGKQNYFPKWIPRPQSYAELNRLIYTKALRASKEECMDLPPLIKQRIEVQLGKEQARMYREMRKEYVTFIEDAHKNQPSQAVVAQLAITKALRLQQIASGFAKSDIGNEISLKENPRLAALSDLIDDLTPGHKVIVWAHFKENIRVITKMLDEKEIGWAQVHGGISDKQAEVDRFTNDEDCRVMVANQAAGGTGTNMIAASYSIFYSRSFSLEHDMQAEARNHRGGSEIHSKITRIDLVAPDTIDELVLEALANKQSIADQILAWSDGI